MDLDMTYFDRPSDEELLYIKYTHIDCDSKL